MCLAHLRCLERRKRQEALASAWIGGAAAVYHCLPYRLLANFVAGAQSRVQLPSENTLKRWDQIAVDHRGFHERLCAGRHAR